MELVPLDGAPTPPPRSPTQSSDSETEADVFSESGDSAVDAEVAARRAVSDPHTAPGQRKFADLPHEILLLVFRHVAVSQLDLRSCILVCRRWCSCGVELLWHRPVIHKLSALFKLIHAMIQADAAFSYASYVRRLNLCLLAAGLEDQLFGRMSVCHRLERLTLAGCSHISDETLARVLACTKLLVAVDLTGVVQLTDRTVEVIAQNCPRLQGTNLSGCKMVTSRGVSLLASSCRLLRRVKLGGCDLMDDAAFLAVVRSCPILLEADFVSCPRLTDASVREVWLHATQLRELRLAHCHLLTDAAFPTPALMEQLERANPPPPLPLAMCEQLRVLDLTSCSNITDDTVRGIINQAPRLRNISLAKCIRLTDEAVYAISALGRNLQYLHLAHVSQITDRAVIHLAHTCTRIRYLDLACCVQLTDASVGEIATNLPKLRRIGLVRVRRMCGGGTDARFRTSRTARYTGSWNGTRA